VATIACMSTLPTGFACGRLLGVHRLHRQTPDLSIKLGNGGIRDTVLVLVHFYVKEVVQMAYKLDATNRVI